MQPLETLQTKSCCVHGTGGVHQAAGYWWLECIKERLADSWQPCRRLYLHMKLLLPKRQWGRGGGACSRGSGSTHNEGLKWRCWTPESSIADYGLNRTVVISWWTMVQIQTHKTVSVGRTEFFIETVAEMRSVKCLYFIIFFLYFYIRLETLA